VKKEAERGDLRGPRAKKEKPSISGALHIPREAGTPQPGIIAAHLKQEQHARSLLSEGDSVAVLSDVPAGGCAVPEGRGEAASEDDVLPLAFEQRTRDLVSSTSERETCASSACSRAATAVRRGT
jgi:hypothetical protein